MEKTLIILKPDCMKENLAGAVISRFAEKGYKICGAKMIELTEDLLKEHYSHVADKPFFPEIVGFMRSHPVMVLALQGNNVIQGVRDILGPTDSATAPKGTIRGDYGTGKMENIVHASDSPENAAIELKRFFKDEEIFAI